MLPLDSPFRPVRSRDLRGSWLLWLVVVALLASSCATAQPASEVRDELVVQLELRPWVEGAGLTQLDEELWVRRFSEICGARSGGLKSLASRYVDEDAHLTSHDDGGVPSVDEASAVLELIAGSVCARPADSD